MDIRKVVKQKYKVNELFCLTSTKASKAIKYDHLNGIQYLLHANTGLNDGIKNMCAFASKGCSSMCFGGVKRQAMDSVWEAKKNRSLLLQNDKDLYLQFYVDQVIKLKNKSIRENKKLVLRLNGTSDKDFVKMGLYNIFPDIQFCEYTKNPILVKKYLNDELPSNLHLTLSRSEINHKFCIECLESGLINVAIPFAGDKPKEWMGFPVIDGDEHDLRYLDPSDLGYVVALEFKRWNKDIAAGLESGFLLEGDNLQDIMEKAKRRSRKRSKGMSGEVKVDSGKVNELESV